MENLFPSLLKNIGKILIMEVKSFFKIVFITVFIYSNNIYSQEDTCALNNLIEYHIIDKHLSYLLDSIIIEVSSFDRFRVLNRDFFVILCIEDTNEFHLIVSPYSCTQFYRTTLNMNDLYNGYLDKNGCLVLISTTRFEFANSFVEKTGHYSNIVFSNSDNLYDHLTPFPYSYFIKKNNEDFIIEESKYTDKESYFYIYKIKSSDTWKKLATKFHCSEQELKLDKKGKEKLIPCNYISIDFGFDNGRIISVMRGM